MHLLLHALFLKMKKTYAWFIYLLLSFYFEFDLNKCSKEIYSFICYYKKEKEVQHIVQNIFYSKYSVVFR